MKSNPAWQWRFILFNWPRRMKPFPAIALIFLAALFSFSASAEDEASWEVEALSQVIPGTVEGRVDYDIASGTAIGTNGGCVRYGAAVLTADTASVNTKSGEVEADGRAGRDVIIHPALN